MIDIDIRSAAAGWPYTPRPEPGSRCVVFFVQTMLALGAEYFALIERPLMTPRTRPEPPLRSNPAEVVQIGGGQVSSRNA